MTQLILKNYTTPTRRVQSILDSFFNDTDFFGSSLNSFNARFHDIEETDDEYKLSIDLPGYSQSEIQIELDRGILYVKAENQKRGLVEQSINLGENIDGEKITAKTENGVLNIVANKLQKYKKKVIAIT